MVVYGRWEPREESPVYGKLIGDVVHLIRPFQEQLSETIQSLRFLISYSIERERGTLRVR